MCVGLGELRNGLLRKCFGVRIEISYWLIGGFEIGIVTGTEVEPCGSGDWNLIVDLEVRVGGIWDLKMSLAGNWEFCFEWAYN